MRTMKLSKILKSSRVVTVFTCFKGIKSWYHTTKAHHSSVPFKVPQSTMCTTNFISLTLDTPGGKYTTQNLIKAIILICVYDTKKFMIDM